MGGGRWRGVGVGGGDVVEQDPLYWGGGGEMVIKDE